MIKLQDIDKYVDSRFQRTFLSGLMLPLLLTIAGSATTRAQEKSLYERVGGYNALDEIQRQGQLEYLTLSEQDRARHPQHGRIEVAARRHDGEHIPGA